MKKLIVSALMALSCGVLFAADDMYLYWMIADDADLSFTDKDGVTIDAPTLSSYNARIAYGDGQYLSLYESVGGASAGSFNAYDAQGWDMLADVSGFHEGNTFFVELFNAAEGTAYKSAPVDYGALEAYMSTMKGQARPADTYGFKSFTAVPEPTSGLLLLLGVAGLALRRKNKKA